MTAVVGSLRAELSATIAQFQKDLGKAADSVKSVSKEFSRLSRDFKTTGDQLQGVGKSLSKTLTLPLLALGVAAGSAAKEFDEAFDKIRGDTGATGKTLEGLKDSFRTVFAEVPNSANDVAEAIAAISSRTGAVGPALEDMATRIANLARLTKANVGDLAASTTRVFGDWSIATDKQASSLDFLFRTSQQTGSGIQALSDLVVQFGAPMRALGFSFEQTAALMGKFEKEGVNLETVMSGLRFALGKFAEAGKDPATAFADVTERIKNAGTESEATAIAFQTFGKRAAIDMSRAIIEGRFNIDELVKSLKTSKDTINDAAADTLSFSEKFEVLRHRVAAALEPLGTRLLDALEDLQPQFEAAVRVLDKLIQGFTSLPKSVQSSLIVLGGVAAAIGPISFVAGQAISSLGTLVGMFGKTGLATKSAITGIKTLKTAMEALRKLDVGGGMFSVLAGGASAGGIGLGIAGMYIVAGELADNFRKKLEAQAEAAKNAGKVMAGSKNSFGNALNTVAEAEEAAALHGQDLVDGLEITIDAFAKAGGGGKGGGAQSFIDRLAAARKEIDALSPAVRRDLTAALESGVFEMKELGEQTGLSEVALKLFKDRLEDVKKSTDDTKTSLESIRDEFEKIAAGIGKLEDQAQEIELAEQFEQARREIEFADTVVDELTTSAEELEAALDDIRKVAGDVGKQFEDIKPAKFGDAVKSLSNDVNNVFQAAFEGGGGVKGAIKSLATSALESFGKFIPVIGPVISKFAGAIVAGFSKLFGGLFGTAGRDAVRQFADAQGGFDALHQRLAELGAEGEQLWISLTQGVGRNNSEQAQAAIERVEDALKQFNETLEANKQKFAEVQAAVDGVSAQLSALTVITPALQVALDDVFDETTAEGMLAAVQRLNTELEAEARKYKDIETALDKYGLKFADAGKQFRQAKLNEKAIELTKDFLTLRDSGVEINTQMRAMGPSIREFVKQAQTAGLEVPNAMKSIIQHAIDAGEIFDEDGKKIGDITELGLTFGDTMETAMKQVGTAVDRLTLVLEGLAKFLGITLPAAAADGAADVNKELGKIEDPVIRPQFEWPEGGPPIEFPDFPFVDGAAGGALVRRWGLQHLAIGGFARGTDTVLAGLTPGELVLNAAQQANVSDALTNQRPTLIVERLEVTGVFSEGDLKQTMVRSVIPALHEAWDDNINGARTHAQDVLQIAPG